MTLKRKHSSSDKNAWKQAQETGGGRLGNQVICEHTYLEIPYKLNIDLSINQLSKKYFFVIVIIPML